MSGLAVAHQAGRCLTDPVTAVRWSGRAAAGAHPAPHPGRKVDSAGDERIQGERDPQVRGQTARRQYDAEVTDENAGPPRRPARRIVSVAACRLPAMIRPSPIGDISVQLATLVQVVAISAKACLAGRHQLWL